MAKKPEDMAREDIDRMLEKAGWDVQDIDHINIHDRQGIAIRDFPLKPSHGFADYILYLDGKAAGVIEAKKAGDTLTGVEIQSDKYKHGLPDILPAWYRPLPFCYESTGVETRFTNGFEPDYRSRNVFSFHRPETLAEWLDKDTDVSLGMAAENSPLYIFPSTLYSRLRSIPTLKEEGLWPAQIKAIQNLEKSLSENRPRAIIQMATGSGKTFTAVTAIYRMIKFAEAKRVLFLVDRANLGRQTRKEFEQYVSPYSSYKFTEEYIVQQLKSNQIDKTARVCISTIQRLYSMLKGEEIDPDLEEESLFDHSDLFKEPMPVEYNPAIPIETFDVIITDECHRSIYHLWRQVLEYFDAFIIGLTATPNKQTFGFFNQNLVMEYPHEQAVADGVNVNYDIYRIRTKITIVKIIREEFGKGNEFCQKITYKTTGKKPDELIAEFRNSYFPRIAVTVDMISTGTDIKPLEIVLFLRTVKSRSYFEQMKGRGVRVINPNDLQSVTPDATAKTHFVIVDAAGVCEQDKTDSRPMERKPSVSLEKLLQAVALGNTETDVISSIAGRLARMEKKLNPEDKAEVQKLAGGKSLKALTGDLVQAIDPDLHVEQAKKDNPGVGEPSSDQIKQATTKIIKESVKPFHNAELRRKLVELHKTTEQIIDTISPDVVIEAGFSADALEKAKGLVNSFEQFIKDHKDEITALQILYSRPYKERLRFEEIKALADLIEKPPYLWRIDRLWEAYAALEKSKVRGAGSHRILTDLVSLIRFALHQEDELEPYAEHVEERFSAWLTGQEKAGKKFSEEQLFWLEKIKEHIVGSLSIDREDFEYTPFKEKGGIGKAYQLFGEGLWPLLDELNEVLAA